MTTGLADWEHARCKRVAGGGGNGLGLRLGRLRFLEIETPPFATAAKSGAPVKEIRKS
jgi:hypothetical protein